MLRSEIRKQAFIPLAGDIFAKDMPSGCSTVIY